MKVYRFLPLLTAALLAACGPAGQGASTSLALAAPDAVEKAAGFLTTLSDRAHRRGAYIDRLEIISRADAFGGTSFGDVGVYEYIAAVAYGKLDPKNPANASIENLDKAPMTDGYVEYQTDVAILRPKNPASARPVLFYDVVNRGNKLAHTLYFNEGSLTADTALLDNPGNGFLMRQGYTVVWSGWQGDIAISRTGGRIGTHFPSAKLPEGSPITRQSLEEFIFDLTIAEDQNPVTANLNYPAANLDPSLATLRVKQRQTDPWRPVAVWNYVNEKQISITRPPEMDRGAIYEFIYPAKDPIVMGIGLAAIRDLVSFLRFEQADAQGNANPLADLQNAPCERKDQRDQCPAKPNGAIEIAILEGISQSGRLARDFIWQGFNADVAGRQVFDGAMPLIAGSRKTWTNATFSQPGRFSRQHEDHFQEGDQFPFSYVTTTDPISGATDGILKKCAASETCPKVFHVDGGGEFWQARASLLTTDGQGSERGFPRNIRSYYMSGTPHAYSTTGISSTAGICKYPTNIVNSASTARALLVALVDWTADRTPPPASRWPTLSAGTLGAPLERHSVNFPDLTGIGVAYTGVHNFLNLTDYSVVPPLADTDRPYQVFVPIVNADGNDVSGVRTPDVVVPLGTHLPWNIRKAGFAEGDACSTAGSFLQFAATDAARVATGDPRRSLAERYGSKAAYVSQVEAAAQSLSSQRLMLQEDVERWVQRAQAVTVLE